MKEKKMDKGIAPLGEEDIKPGDRVVCIDNRGVAALLAKGAEYVVRESSSTYLDIPEGGFWRYRFRLATPPNASEG